DDYAFLIQALLDLFEATSEAGYLQHAVRLARTNLKQFEDEAGGFFSTLPNTPDLVLRMKDDYDGAEPSGNSVATDVLLRLAHLTGDEQFRAAADRSLRSFGPKLQAQPTIAPQMLVALGRSLAEPEQVVIRCQSLDDRAATVLGEHRRKFSPYASVLAITDDGAAALREMAPFLASLERKGRITVYECRSFACALPQNIV
ncbi:MAG: thioredoxin domain-containing protein, partial [Acidobacteriaceae bacterium]|nr:thioredoxin domain-containing protein [Acidobacteriaceae bacterium]